MHDRDPIWAADSQAAVEVLAAKSASEWHGAALHEAQMLPFALLMVIEDHFYGLAATLLAKKTIIASVSLIRPILEASARCYYLIAPGIGFEERARRGLNIRLQQRVETLNIVNDPSDRSPTGARIRDEAARRLDALVRGAIDAGHEVREGKGDRLPPGIAAPRWVEPRIPSAQQLIGALFQGDDIAPFFHRFTSGVLHAQTHALAPFIVADEGQLLPTGDYRVPFGVSGSMMAPLLAGPVSATYYLIEWACSYYGWPVAQWQRDGLPTLVKWRRWMGT